VNALHVNQISAYACQATAAVMYTTCGFSCRKWSGLWAPRIGSIRVRTCPEPGGKRLLSACIKSRVTGYMDELIEPILHSFQSRVVFSPFDSSTLPYSTLLYGDDLNLTTHSLLSYFSSFFSVSIHTVCHDRLIIVINVYASHWLLLPPPPVSLAGNFNCLSPHSAKFLLI
jgi:hypothetical protein